MLSIELKRQFRDPLGLFFIAGLPAFMYVIFGATSNFGEAPLPGGNVSMTIMIAMAAYGAATATSAISAQAAVEKKQGWGRQLGLTPMSDAAYVRLKTTTSVVISLIPIGLIYLIGFVTNAEGDPSSWIISLLVVFAGAIMFGIYGLIFGFAFRSESAASAAAGLLVPAAFLGNLFTPLSGLLLDISRFSPMYGIGAVARYPVTRGENYDMSGNLYTEPLWYGLVNMVVWTIIFIVLAMVVAKKGRERQ